MRAGRWSSPRSRLSQPKDASVEVHAHSEKRLYKKHVPMGLLRDSLVRLQAGTSKKREYESMATVCLMITIKHKTCAQICALCCVFNENPAGYGSFLPVDGRLLRIAFCSLSASHKQSSLRFCERVYLGANATPMHSRARRFVLDDTRGFYQTAVNWIQHTFCTSRSLLCN